MKRYRLLAISVLGIAGVLLAALFVGNINGNLVYFLTPREALAQQADFGDGRRFQLGGLVQEGSVAATATGLAFVVVSGTGDGAAAVPVSFSGSPAQLFRAGVGVVLEGAWDGNTFVSDSMKVKHDENYRPPDPADASTGRSP